MSPLTNPQVLRMKRFLYLCCLLVSLPGCDASFQDSHQQGLIYCSEGNPESFNPQVVTSGTSIDAASYNIYNQLVRVDPESLQLEPGLATAWEISDDATHYRFKLRHGVHFHNTDYFTPTREFDADDVLFSFQRIIDPNNAYHNENAGQYPFFDSIGFKDLVQSVNKIDDYTVEFVLKRPDSTFLDNLSTSFAVILSAEYADQLAKAGDTKQLRYKPIGTGPFKFVEYRPDRFIKYVRNDDYWAGPVPLKKLVYDITPNSSMRLVKLLTHECDAIAYPLASDLDLLKEKTHIRVQKRTGFNVGYWAFNTEKPPFDDRRVREAMAYAVDRAKMLDAVYYGTATPAKSLLPPNSWAYDKALTIPKYDLKKAKRLLREAGYPHGFTFDLWTMPVQRSYNPNPQKMALLLKQSLAEIGVHANIVSYEWNIFRQRIRQGKHQSVLIGWTADNSDPDNFLRPLLSCQGITAGTNRANWCDPKFDKLLNDAIRTTDRQQRQVDYQQAQQLVAKELPLIPIAHALRIQAHYQTINHLPVLPFGGIDFSKAQWNEQ